MSDLRIATIQTNLTWENKTANLAMLEQKIAGITHAEVIVLPEMFSTGFSMKPELLAEGMHGETIGWMRRLSREKRMIVTGSVIIHDDGHFFNRLIWMQPDGNCGTYDKRHLFGYAGENDHYYPGDKRLIASVNGWRINLQVCYDLRFPVWSRQQMGADQNNKPEFDAIIYVANWPERRSLAWKTLLQARAIENQCYVIGVNRVGVDGNGINHSGDSMVIGPLGDIMYHCVDEEDIQNTTLSKTNLTEVREKFPFWKDADLFRIF